MESVSNLGLRISDFLTSCRGRSYERLFGIGAGLLSCCQLSVVSFSSAPPTLRIQQVELERKLHLLVKLIQPGLYLGFLLQRLRLHLREAKTALALTALRSVGLLDAL